MLDRADVQVADAGLLAVDRQVIQEVCSNAGGLTGRIAGLGS